MAYNPEVTYRGDLHLASGIMGFGQAVAEGIDEYRRNKEESQFYDQQFEAMMQAAQPYVTSGAVDEKTVSDWGKFSGLSTSAKRGKLASAQFTLNNLMQREQANQQRQSEVERQRVANEYLKLQQVFAAQGQQDRETQDRDTQNFLRTIMEQDRIAEAAQGNGVPYRPEVLAAAQDPRRRLLSALSAGPRVDPNVLGVAASESDPTKAITAEANLIRAQAYRDEVSGRGGGGETSPVDRDTLQFNRRMFQQAEWKLMDAMSDPKKRQDGAVINSLRTARDYWSGQLQGGQPAAPSRPAPTGQGKTLSREKAADFLKQAGGDKDKARRLAREAGYTF